MGKLFNSMIMGTIAIFTLLIFDSSGQTPTSLFLLLLNPVDYKTSSFYLLFGISSLATISGGILIGTAALLRQDWLMRAGFVTSLSSIVIFPFVDLFRFIVAKTNYIASNCVGSPVCSQLNAINGMGQIFGLVFVGPLFLYAFWACIEYIWKGDS